MSTSPRKLQEIFDREISRLHSQALAGPLDMADLSRLEKLVNSYSKYKDQRFREDDDYEDASTDVLLGSLKAAKNDPTPGPTDKED